MDWLEDEIARIARKKVKELEKALLGEDSFWTVMVETWPLIEQLTAENVGDMLRDIDLLAQDAMRALLKSLANQTDDELDA